MGLVGVALLAGVVVAGILLLQGIICWLTEERDQLRYQFRLHQDEIGALRRQLAAANLPPCEQDDDEEEPNVPAVFNAPCIRCGENAVSLDLDDLHQCRCRECEETFDVSDVRAMLNGWGPVLAWIDAAPQFVAVKPAAPAAPVQTITLAKAEG